MQDILNTLQEAKRSIETYDGTISGNEVLWKVVNFPGVMYLPKTFFDKEPEKKEVDGFHAVVASEVNTFLRKCEQIKDYQNSAAAISCSRYVNRNENSRLTFWSGPAILFHVRGSYRLHTFGDMFSYLTASGNRLINLDEFINNAKYLVTSDETADQEFKDTVTMISNHSIDFLAEKKHVIMEFGKNRGPRKTKDGKAETVHSVQYQIDLLRLIMKVSIKWYKIIQPLAFKTLDIISSKYHDHSQIKNNNRFNARAEIVIGNYRIKQIFIDPSNFSNEQSKDAQDQALTDMFNGYVMTKISLLEVDRNRELESLINKYYESPKISQ